MCNWLLKLKADRARPHRQTPWNDNDSFLLFSALGKAEPILSTTSCQKLDLDPDLWPWPWPLALTLKQGNSEVKIRFFCIWPWPLPYELGLQSQPSQDQGRPSYQKSRSKVKWFSRECVDWWRDGRTDSRTDGRTDGRTLRSTLSPSFAVNNDSDFKLYVPWSMHLTIVSNWFLKVCNFVASSLILENSIKWNPMAPNIT